MSDSNNELSSGLTNHKRSHSFNNHQSYTQHTQQTQKSKQKNQSARWLLNSCDSLDQSPSKTNKVPIGKKFSSVDFIDAADSNYGSKGWSITCLRPAPPLRPQSFTVGSDENIGPTHPYAPHQRKSNSYEEDALILKVIEAYCTSARCRNAVSSECDDESSMSIEALVRSPSLPIHSTSNHGSPSLWTIVMRLQNEIKTLKLDVKNLQLQLYEEKQDRTLAIAALQSRNILKDAKESKC
ncbi:jg9326 [Pararge aegeria aegeria]|uniref:Jg9326 protein n=2 Tax=Pararge aegeria TaxID=116150 RepID=A0A8S4RX53_9NEOP|nr:jg9326 [Pararge aegeria aegeria]